MKLLTDRLLPSVMDILDDKEEFYPGTIGELKEYLDTHRYWKEIPYYILECLMCHVYGFEAGDVTESKMDILFRDEE